MATNTSYLGLTKPAQSDLYNVDVFNDNADAVDANAQKTAANLATIESVATASKLYAVGEYLVLNGILYKVTQAIANGGALVVGTNIAQDNVGTELKSIKDAISEINSRLTADSLAETTGVFLQAAYGGDANHPINIDSLIRPSGYVIRCVAGSYLSGTRPPITGNAFLLIGFSGGDSGRIVFGSQLAICFGNSNIYVRNANYSSSGSTWSAWRTI